MRIEYLHASKYGNGAMVAQELVRWTRVRPIMIEILQRKGLVEVAKARSR
jgi:hypothetical protein